VIGIGSPHGDDAIGLEAVRRLSNERLEYDGWDCHAVESGARLLDLLAGSGRLILIDALRQERPVPGTIHRFVWPDPRIEAIRPGSTHALGAVQALQLAAALGQLPERIVIFAVEISCSEPGAALSQQVSEAVPELLGLVRQEIDAMQCGG
jgi:hydrogenase maturation protease